MQPATRERLLKAAGQIFAEKGFHYATVRDICRRADANVAAIHYHFGDKQGLYEEVLHYGAKLAVEKYPPDLGLSCEPTPEERLHAFIRSLLLRTLDSGEDAWHGKLMIREMADPTPGLAKVAAGVIRPLTDRLQTIVRDLLGPEAGEDQVRYGQFSIAGQCLFHRHAAPIIRQLYPRQTYSLEAIERLAEHITLFSLRAMDQLSKDYKRQAVAR